jgi:antirestriction protein ArdC
MVYAPCYKVQVFDANPPPPRSLPVKKQSAAAPDRKNVYKLVTDKIISQLRSGTVPWHKPWAGGFQAPRNLKSGKKYRGINVFLLSMAGFASPYLAHLQPGPRLGGSSERARRARPSCSGSA